MVRLLLITKGAIDLNEEGPSIYLPWGGGGRRRPKNGGSNLTRREEAKRK